MHKYVVDYGGDGETVILLHGFVSSSKYWKRIQPKLSRLGYRVVTIDLLGFGKAPKPLNADYSYDDHLKHIDDTLNYLSITKPFHVIAHSMGALLAIRYARQQSQRIKTVTLLHPPIFKDQEQARNALISTGRFYRFLLESRYRNYAWIVLRNIGLVARHSSYSREGSMANIIEKAEILDDLREVEHDTLVIVGTKDRKEYIFNLQNRRFNPHVKIVVERTGHHSAQLQPNLIVQHLVKFISTPH